MVELREQLRQDLKDAMRARETVRRDTIRLLEAAIKNAEIEARGSIDEADLHGLIQKQVRQRQESITQFVAGARPDLADRERAEITILQAYLPAQMDRDAVTQAARAVIDRTGASSPGEKGKVMGPLMAELRGRADGRLVNEVVSELLGA